MKRKGQKKKTERKGQDSPSALIEYNRNHVAHILSQICDKIDLLHITKKNT